MPSISFRDVGFVYEDGDEAYRALEHVDLEISDGELVCLVGHSGCGKSTLLRLLAGLAVPTEGTIEIDGRRVQGAGPDRSIVFQNYSLFPWQTALKNVEFALRKTHGGMPKAEARAKALDLLAQVKMEEAAKRYPFQLSGGMRQRVAIARALAVDAPVMLLDEPFGALDPLIREQLQTLLLELWDAGGGDAGKTGAAASENHRLDGEGQGGNAPGACGGKKRRTIVFVTHDIDEAVRLASRIVFMEPGRIVAGFTLDPARDRSPEKLAADEATMQVKREVLALFEASARRDGGKRAPEEAR